MFKRKPKHQVSDITSVSISFAHMMKNYCYFFCLYKKNDWYLNCKCSINDYKEEIEIETIVLIDDVNQVLKIINDEGLILETERFKYKPLRYTPLDASIYTFNLEFNDGIIKTTNYYQVLLKDLFYKLANKYYEGEKR